MNLIYSLFLFLFSLLPSFSPTLSVAQSPTSTPLDTTSSSSSGVSSSTATTNSTTSTTATSYANLTTTNAQGSTIVTSIPITVATNTTPTSTSSTPFPSLTGYPTCGTSRPRAKKTKGAFPSLTFELKFSPFFFFSRAANRVVINCLTEAVAQVNCTSITAVACYCSNQYVQHILSLLVRLFLPCRPPIGHSHPQFTPASRPIAVRMCPQRNLSPKNSARSTVLRFRLRLLQPRPHHLPRPLRQQTPPRPARSHLMLHLGCLMRVDGLAWLSRPVAPCSAPHSYSPVILIVTVLWQWGWFLNISLFFCWDRAEGSSELIGQCLCKSAPIQYCGLEKRNCRKFFPRSPFVLSEEYTLATSDLTRVHGP